MGLDIKSALGGAASGFIGSGFNPWGALAGGAMGLLGGGGTASAPNIPMPTPMDIYGPYGNITFNGGAMNMSESAPMQDIRRSVQGALGGGYGALNPMEQQLSGLAMGYGGQLDALGNQLGGLASGVGGLQNTLGGLFGQTAGLDPFLARQQGMFSGAGAGALNMGMGDLAQAGAIDPTSVAQTQFDRMQNLLQPLRQRQLGDTESRLMRQGLLGSTAGGNQFRAMREANAMQDAQIASQALEQGMNTRGQALSQATGVGGFGAGLMGQGVGVAGQRQGLFGQLGNLTGQSAGLMGAQANLLGQQAGMIPAAYGMASQPLSIADAARSRYGQGVGLLGQLQQMQLAPASLAMAPLGAQTQASLANANMQYDAAMNRSDATNAMLFGGLSALNQGGGFNWGGLFGGGGGGASVPSSTNPMFMMQNPYGAGAAADLGLGFNPMAGVKF